MMIKEDLVLYQNVQLFIRSNNGIFTVTVCKYSYAENCKYSLHKFRWTILHRKLPINLSVMFSYIATQFTQNPQLALNGDCVSKCIRVAYFLTGSVYWLRRLRVGDHRSYSADWPDVHTQTGPSHSLPTSILSYVFWRHMDFTGPV